MTNVKPLYNEQDCDWAIREVTRTAFCDLHWIGLGVAVIVGFGLAYGCRKVRRAEPGYAHALYGCWPKSRSPAAWRLG